MSLLGEEGQRRLLDSTVAVVGLGGLGSIVALYLAAAGVGRLVIVDPDVVEVHNLNRQLLYGEPDLGLPKAYAAARRLRELRSDLRVVPVKASIEEGAARDAIREADVVVDALDNWRARLALADTAWEAGMPLVHAAVERYYAQLTTIKSGLTSCLHCIAPARAEQRCVSVIGPAVGVAASLEALEVIKIIAGIGEPLYNKLLVIDALTPSIDTIELKPIPCSECRSGDNA